MNRVLLISFAALICCIWCEQGHTRNPNFFDRVLSRKRRFLLFPPGSAIVATMSMTKTLVPKSPSGINMIAEVDIFYPLQTQISDYFPTKPPPPVEDEEEGEDEEEEAGPPTKPASNGAASSSASIPGTKPTKPEPPTEILQDGGDNYNPQSHPGEIYVTGPPKRIDSNKLYDIKYRKPSFGYSIREPYFWRPPQPAHPMTPVRHRGSPFVRHTPFNVDFNNNYLSEADLMLNAQDSDILRPPDTVLHARNRPQARDWNEPRRRAMLPTGGTASGNYYHHDRNIRNEQNGMHRQNAESDGKTMENYVDDIENHQSWQHYHRYKERRDLFSQLQAITSFDGFDVKTCIYRMICEANHFLLPPGKSLFQDIFRILFVLPEHPHINDGYSDAMRKNATECSTHFGMECRYSILGYILHNQLRAKQ